MTKTKKTIMWATIACLLVVGVAGGAVGVTYSRYASSGTGTGSATIAYWDVAVAPTDSTSVSVYASPSATEYSSESYSEGLARSTTSDLLLAATLTNSGDVAAAVKVSVVENSLSYTLRGNVDTSSESTNIENYLSATSLAAHFKVELYQSTSEDGSSTTELGDDVTLPASTVGSESVRTNSYLYIYCDLVWTSDTGEDCFGDTADAFDTWIGTNVESINFELSYTAVQAA
ncbi:MAG: hypothetical protein LUD22_03920 [Coprobacillus sp.]|nr:hypothetical protein [Coprobacillus sp.]